MREKKKTKTSLFESHQFRMLGLIVCVGIVLIYLTISIYRRYDLYESKTKLVSADDYQGSEQAVVPLIKEMDFRDLSIDSILNLRQERAQASADLLANRYQPTKAVFNKLEENKFWPSMGRLYYFGKKNPKNTIHFTESAASRTILNPLLLVKAEFWGLSIWGPRNLEWDKARATISLLSANNIPLAPRESALTYLPKESQASITYDVTEFLASANPFLSKPLGKEQTAFAINLPNARDFGFRFMSLDLAQSVNIVNEKQPITPTAIGDYFGFVQSGWSARFYMNHMSSAVPSYDWIQASAFPAAAIIKLWYSEPESVGDPADFNFIIKIK